MKKYLYVPATKRNKNILSKFPNAGPSCNVKGMRNLFWGKDALLIKCGAYVYHVDCDTFARFYFA